MHVPYKLKQACSNSKDVHMYLYKLEQACSNFKDVYYASPQISTSLYCITIILFRFFQPEAH